MVEGKQLGPKARGQDLPHVDAYTLLKLISTGWPCRGHTGVTRGHTGSEVYKPLWGQEELLP